MTENTADEIDLIELLEQLWDGKWLIAGVSAAALAIGAAYVRFTPNNFDASILIRPIDAATTDQFRSLNDAINFSQGVADPTLKFFFSTSSSLRVH